MSFISSAIGMFTGGASKLWLYLAAALVLSVLLGWLFWSRAELKADLATAEANVSTLQAANRASARAIESMQAATRRTDIALAERERTLAQISAQRQALRLKLSEALRNDPETRNWYDAHIPVPVRGLLK